MGILDHLTSLLRNLYAGQEATVKTGYGKMELFKIGRADIKAVYCHPAYLTCMQNTSWKVPGWMKLKLESKLLGEISITSDMQMIPPLLAESKEELNSFFFFLFLFIFFIEGQLLYRILFSVKPQHELAIGIHIFPPFWTSLPSPAPSHPSRLIQSHCLSFLRHTANSFWLPILRMVI